MLGFCQHLSSLIPILEIALSNISIISLIAGKGDIFIKLEKHRCVASHFSTGNEEGAIAYVAFSNRVWLKLHGI